MESEIDLLPYSIEAEEAVLGGILLDPVALDAVIERLAPEHFYVESHRFIYGAMVGLHIQGRPPAPVLLMEQLLATGKLQAAGGGSQIRRLQETALHAISLDIHAEVVREKWRRRRVLHIFRDGYRRAAEATNDLDEIVDACATDLAQLSGGPGRGEVPLGELLMAYFEHLERVGQQTSPPGVSTSYYDLDRLLGGGLQQGNLVYLCGAPGSGKTSLALNLMLEAARRGTRCLFFSLEMGENSLMQRILGTEAQIESHRLASGRLSPVEWSRIGDALGRLASLGVDVSLDQSLKASEIATRTKLWMRKHAVDPAHCLVVVDHHTLVRAENNRDDTRMIVARASGIWRELKNELRIPLMVLSQLNREVFKRSNKRPTLADMQESARLEQDADVVLGLYRDEYFNPDSPERGIAEAILLKHRNGPTGTVRLLFEDRFARFLNIAS